MTEIKRVDPEVLKTESVNIGKYKEEWEGHVKDITMLAGELSGMWKGSASEKFIERWENDVKRYNDLTGLLERSKAVLAKAADSYDSCEAEIAKIIGS